MKVVQKSVELLLQVSYSLYLFLYPQMTRRFQEASFVPVAAVLFCLYLCMPGIIPAKGRVVALSLENSPPSLSKGG